jgi:hypothetical protein
MTGWVWAAIVIGLAIVTLAVGIPYFHTHKIMRSPRDLSDSHEYVRAKRRWRRQRDAAAAQPAQARFGGSRPPGEGP